MRISIISLFLTFVSLSLYGQDCNILSKANSILPDRLCSPLSVNWNVSYTGVDNAGTSVQIRYDWDDGTIDTENTLNPSPGVFESTKVHTYVSTGQKCNYRPTATLVVNGVLCSSSTQQQIVTVWDNDDHNGGHMHINPTVYPICFGNGANVRFQDLTQFNCVPPQESDVPNLYTRWVQWIYGTDITMTGIPVTVDGTLRTYPFSGPVITLPGPVTGSGVYSQTMNVANDKLIGQYFQVTLRNWNYCNPYDDPNIPGPPVDPVNGDHPPVVTTAIILIVPYPDATITPVDTLCIENNPVTLHAHDSGGRWSGDGVSGNTFDPGAAGAGDHIISYTITDGNGCSASDQITITVVTGPMVNIVPVSTLFINDPPVILSATPAGGTFSGDGVTGTSFSPVAAGTGVHIITYQAGTNRFGCTGMDTIHIKVLQTPPDATITPVDTLCVLGNAVTLVAKDPGGTWSGDGVSDDKFYPGVAGAGNHIISYEITDINGYKATDQITITVVPIPVIDIVPVATQYLNDPPLILNATPQGGIWTGNGVTGSSFFPDSAGVGNHVITYTTTTDKFGCWNSDTVHIKVIMPPGPVADFVPDTTGCTPLVVKFRNTSKNAVSYLWDFGDRTSSSDKNPSHTYNIPGTYIVKLTVINIAGESSRNGSVKVYQNPTAQFNVYPTEVINNSQIVVFSDYSYYGVSWLWDFGDGTTSSEENPWHKYAAEGQYKVTLQVTSRDGCVDSSTFLTPVVVAYRTGNIRFPNVFRWNGYGPTGGYWAEGEIDDNTFRPFYTNVIEYKLQIFNRWGVLIYESIELHKGWDGYFGNAHLALEGVYVYKVVGRYADGTYFTKVGDVTFLH